MSIKAINAVVTFNGVEFIIGSDVSETQLDTEDLGQKLIEAEADIRHLVIPIVDEQTRVLIIGDDISPSVAIALKRLSRAARDTAQQLPFDEFYNFMLNNVAQAYEIPLHMLAFNPTLAEPVDPRIHLAPNHQDYTPNHHKQRRGKFKRSGR